MARIRTIKPDFWTDERLTECSLSARLFFVGMWNFSDDNGNLGRSARKLKAQIFPCDTIDCEPLIIELINIGVLVEYAVNDEKFLHIKGFTKHQVINRPSKTTIPKYDDSLRTHVALTEHSLTEGKGREGKGKELITSSLRSDVSTDGANADAGDNPKTDFSDFQETTANPASTAARQAKASTVPLASPADFVGEENENQIPSKAIVRLSPKFDLPTEWGEYAERLGFQPPEIIREAEKFKEYWANGRGKGTRRNIKNWRQSWNNWINKSAEKRV